MKFFFSIFALLVSIPVFSQNMDTPKEIQKQGWSVAGLPIIAYNSDVGFKYGGFVNFYNFGDGSQYPDYKHYYYIEYANTTKKNLSIFLKYDSKYLIPNYRVTAEIGYFTDAKLNFFGYNGYSAFYNSQFVDKHSHDYISEAYYWMNQQTFKTNISIQKKLAVRGLELAFACSYHDIKIGSVDIDKLNKGKSDADTLPHVQYSPGLYEKFIAWGFINSKEKDGGNLLLTKFGVVYDTRDNEANAMNGMFTRLIFNGGRIFGGAKNSFLYFNITQCQYFTLYPHILSFAYRMGFQHKIAGSVPYYMIPNMYHSIGGPASGLGGGNSMRGIFSRRVAGEGFVFGNYELRLKIWRTVIRNNNFYIAVNAFYDAGIITQKYMLKTTDPQGLAYLSLGNKEKLHSSTGGGIYFTLNDNFVIAVNYARAFNKQDGISGTYIGFDFMF